MLKIELVPDPTHCIETVAKREYSAVLRQLLTPGEVNKELEEKLEILRLFLEGADLGQLRAETERLMMEGKKVKFVAFLDNGMPKHEIYVT